MPKTTKLLFILLCLSLLLNLGLGAISGYYLVKQFINPTRLTVDATGEISVAPTNADVFLNLSTSKTNQADAKKALDASILQLTNALSGQGIENKDISTQNYSIHKSYKYLPNGSSNEDGYQGECALKVTLKDINKISKVYDVIYASNDISSTYVSFSLADKNKSESEARLAAIDNAKAKAKQNADAMGKKLGNIVEIKDKTSNSGIIYPVEKGAATSDGNALSSSPIFAGEQKVTSEVEVIFELN